MKKFIKKILDTWYGILPILLLLSVPLALCIAIGWRSIPAIITALSLIGGGSWLIGVLLVLFGAIGFLNIMAGVFNQAEKIGKKHGNKAFVLYLATTLLGMIALNILLKRV